MTDLQGGTMPPMIPEESTELRRTPRWRWWVHFLLLAAYPVVIGGMAFLNPDHVKPALTSTVKGLLIVCALELLVFGAVFAVAWLASRVSARELLVSGPLHLRDVPLSLIYSIGLRVGVAVLGAVVAMAFVAVGALRVDELQDFVATNRPEVESLVDVKALASDPVYMVLNITLVSFVVAGFREELWRAAVLAGLRALWPTRFSSTFGQIVAVSLAAVLFGAGHLSQGTLAVFLTAALGFMLGIIMVFHKSIWPAVLAHGAFNATSFLLLPVVMKYVPGM